MPNKFAAIFTSSGLIIILTMFISIVGNVDCQVEIDNNTHVISAFAG